MKKLFIFLLLIITPRLIHAMDLRIDINEVDIFHYYHHENKELNFSNILIGDANLAILEPLIKTFVESVGVERLIIENANLKTVPLNLIGFSFLNKTLKYVSFLGNNFFPPQQHEDAEVRPRSNSILEEAVSHVWGNISPEIERAILEHNSNGSKFNLYSKIIVIDKGVPPVTIIDSKRKPYSKMERAKYILVRCGLVGVGIVITAIPSIMTWCLEFLGDDAASAN